MTIDTDRVLDRLAQDADGAVERLSELLRIPSISTDPAHRAETRRAGQHLADDLAGLGFEARLHETPGHPLVVAHHEGSSGGRGPRILYYGHYDVQPPDPLQEWTSPPFEPTIVDGPLGKRIVARGAVDDKGQLMTFVEALRAWHATHGAPPVSVTVLLEGEEESGSPSLDPFLEKHRGDLAADVCVVSDTNMWNIRTPAITTMLRGLVYLEVVLEGPGHDLHSGVYGGAVVNPINALCTILSELKGEDGVVRIPGFYDDVEELSAEQSSQWTNLNFDEAAFLASAGLKTPRGEAGRSTLERTWSRPTLDVNGIIGGYTGEGAKTVIAARASAKLSCRLVPAQDAERVRASLEQFLRDRTPPDCRMRIHCHGCSRAIRVRDDSPYLEAAKRGLSRVFDTDPVLVGCGGSIPVVGSIQRILGFDSLLVGFGLDDDRVHSPNEKFELTCFANGMRSHAVMLAEFAQM